MLYEFDCSICGKIDSKSVAGVPKHPERMICSECEREVGDKPRYDLSAVRNAPRRKHNTRVAFNIICSSCKEEKQLDYVPKGVSMEEIQCNDCMDKNQESDARWRLVQEQKDKEQAKKDFPFICDGCGCEWSVPFRTKADRLYYCDDCQPKDPDAEPDPDAPPAPRSKMPSTEAVMTDGMTRRRRKKKPPVKASWSDSNPEKPGENKSGVGNNKNVPQRRSDGGAKPPVKASWSDSNPEKPSTNNPEPSANKTENSSTDAAENVVVPERDETVNDTTKLTSEPTNET